MCVCVCAFFKKKKIVQAYKDFEMYKNIGVLDNGVWAILGNANFT